MKSSTVTSRSRSNQHEVAAWAEHLGRFGLAARGVVYIVLGFLAAKAGFSTGGQMTDQQGAMREIGQSPYGTVMLWIVGLGLVGFVLWRLAEAFMDIEHYGREAKGLMKRGAAVVSGVVYASLSMTALALAIGSTSSSRSGGDAVAEDRTAWLLSQPFGRWLVGAVALIVLGVALFQFYQALMCEFAKHLRSGDLSGEPKKWSIRAGQIGYAARGIAFTIISWFFLQAAMQSDASEAGGLASALHTVARQPYGPWMMGLVGTGLGLFGIYSIIEARYRRIG
jgi:hypothetical protein